MNKIRIEDIDLKALAALPTPQADKIRIEIINSYPLEHIPSVFLPKVYDSSYYFISYSHKDYRSVYEDLFAFDKEGLQVWYDRGIPAGKHWKETAAKFLAPFACQGVIFYISENSLQSKAILDEMEYALKLKKPFITIHLPFVSDYLFEGESVKGKVFDVNKMVKIMEENGVIFASEAKKTLEELFPVEMIYLSYETPISTRVEKIRLNLPEPPLFSYDANHITVLSLNNIDAFKVEPKDFDLVKPQNELSYVNYSLGDCSFANARNLESVTFPKGLWLLPSGRYVFYNCVNLRFIHNLGLQSQVREAMFSGCINLEEIETNAPMQVMQVNDFGFMNCHSLDFSFLGDLMNLNYIGRGAFSGCDKLIDIDLPSLYHIGHQAFNKCHNLRRIHLHGATEIGNSIFSGCENLEEILIDEGDYTSINGVLYKKDKERLILEGYPLKREKIRLDPKCKVIGKGVFSDLTKRETIEIPEGVTTIGHFAFSGSTSLKEIILPSTISFLADMPFWGCSNLKFIKIKLKKKKAKEQISASIAAFETSPSVKGFDCLDGFLPFEELKD